MLQIKPQLSNIQDEQPATFEQPISLLLSCHEKILHFSSALCIIVEHLQKDGWNQKAIQSVAHVRRYFNIASTQHHLDEELHLFPAIVALADKNNDDNVQHDRKQSREINERIELLIQEHVESDELWLKLDQLLAKQSNDFNLLVNLAEQFKVSMHAHAAIENELIFPYAKEHITEAQLKEIGLQIARRRGIEI